MLSVMPLSLLTFSCLWRVQAILKKRIQLIYYCQNPGKLWNVRFSISWCRVSLVVLNLVICHLIFLDMDADAEYRSTNSFVFGGISQDRWLVKTSEINTFTWWGLLLERASVWTPFLSSSCFKQTLVKLELKEVRIKQNLLQINTNVFFHWICCNSDQMNPMRCLVRVLIEDLALHGSHCGTGSRGRHDL